MGLRDWINQNSSLATIAAIALLVVALGWLTVRTTGSRTLSPGDAYFYDMNTGEVFVDSAERVPPITSPDGNEAVRAYFYACGECTEDRRFLGYFEKFTEEAKQVKEMPVDQLPTQKTADGTPQWEKTLEEGTLLSTDGEEWKPARPNSPTPIENQLAAEHCGEGERLRECRPE